MKTEKTEAYQENKPVRLGVGLWIVRILNEIIDHLVLLLLLLLCVYGIYAMWDSKQIYQEAQSVQYEKYKPAVDDSVSFEELSKINPEVFSWLTVYGTEIDYPVAQASDNQKYINTNIVGDFSLAGSIYLDSGNRNDFTDFNSIIYGHHMEANAMFGNLDRFRDQEYFDSHLYGNLFYNGQDYGLEFFAYLLADAYDWTIYQPGIKGDAAAKESYLAYLKSNAEYTREITIGADDRIVLLSTCASESTNGRYILAAKLTEESFEDPFAVGEDVQDSRVWSRVDSQSIKSWAEQVSFFGWIIILIIIILILIMLIMLEKIYLKRKVSQKRGSDHHTDNQAE